MRAGQTLVVAALCGILSIQALQLHRNCGAAGGPRGLAPLEARVVRPRARVDVGGGHPDFPRLLVAFKREDGQL